MRVDGGSGDGGITGCGGVFVCAGEGGKGW